jgi:competence protein ComEA
MEYFNFTKKERNGIYALLAVILLLIILPLFFPFFISAKKYDHKDLEASIATLKNSETDSSSIDENNDTKNYSSNTLAYTSYSKKNLFYFDPNTLSAEGWKRLGVRDKTIQTIQKYLFKGGKFYKPEDISKIWGLGKEESGNLIPYVKIETVNTPHSYYKKDDNENAYTPYKKESSQLININTADTTAFIALPGIASKLANRIIQYRNKLGGFYSIEQIGETFGLRDSIFQLIKPRLTIGNTTITQININTATADEMKTHPYIHYAIANAIVQYRTQHGNFSNVSDLKKIILITDDTYIKMVPYLKVAE